jgi:hypothetical protein
MVVTYPTEVRALRWTDDGGGAWFGNRIKVTLGEVELPRQAVAVANGALFYPFQSPAARTRSFGPSGTGSATRASAPSSYEGQGVRMSPVMLKAGDVVRLDPMTNLPPIPGACHLHIQGAQWIL